MAAQKSSRSMIVILSIGGVLVLGLLLVNLTKGGGSSSSTPPATDAPASALTPGGTTATTTPGEPTIPAGEFDVFATRNPFEPVVQIETASSSTAATGATTAGATTEVPGESATAATGATSAGQAPATGTSVAVLDVFEQDGKTLARVQVGSTVYTVAEGETFAGSYKAVSLSGTCGQFLFGDSPFSLCEGEQVIK